MDELGRTRIRWAAIGAAVAVTLGAAGLGGMNLASAEISSGERPVYVPIDGCRLVDTRSDPAFNVGDKSTPFGPNETLTVTAHGDNGDCTGPNAIPTDALGLALNVTAVDATVETFITVWGEGADPGTSNLNPAPGQPPTPNAVNTPLTDTGTFNVRNNVGSVDVIIDITGYYADHNHDDRNRSVIVAARAFSSGTVDSVVGLPDGATLTITNPSTGTYAYEFDGIEDLGAGFAFPIVTATAIGSDGDVCLHGGGGGLFADPLERYSSTINCTTANGTDTNTSFSFSVTFGRD